MFGCILIFATQVKIGDSVAVLAPVFKEQILLLPKLESKLQNTTTRRKSGLTRNANSAVTREVKSNRSKDRVATKMGLQDRVATNSSDVAQNRNVSEKKKTFQKAIPNSTLGTESVVRPEETVESVDETSANANSERSEVKPVEPTTDDVANSNVKNSLGIDKESLKKGCDIINSCCDTPNFIIKADTDNRTNANSNVSLIDNHNEPASKISRQDIIKTSQSIVENINAQTTSSSTKTAAADNKNVLKNRKQDPATSKRPLSSNVARKVVNNKIMATKTLKGSSSDATRKPLISSATSACLKRRQPQLSVSTNDASTVASKSADAWTNVSKVVSSSGSSSSNVPSNNKNKIQPKVPTNNSSIVLSEGMTKSNNAKNLTVKSHANGSIANGGVLSSELRDCSANIKTKDSSEVSSTTVSKKDKLVKPILSTVVGSKTVQVSTAGTATSSVTKASIKNVPTPTAARDSVPTATAARDSGDSGYEELLLRSVRVVAPVMLVVNKRPVTTAQVATSFIVSQNKPE